MFRGNRAEKLSTSNLFRLSSFTFADCMQAPILHNICNQKLWLSPQRAIFWEEEKALILSDLHFGKTGHFRKSGIAVPQQVYKEDLQRLVVLIEHFKPVELVVVGDFFHSRQNAEMEWFRKWRDDFSSLQITLVRGNHDILKNQWYKDSNIKVLEDRYVKAPFVFSHEPCSPDKDNYLFCGHIHPGILLEGVGRQSLRLPCFYFGQNMCILPAFSKFTGVALVSPEPEDQVFALVENKIIPM
jgi:uncharacterized protein